MWWFRPVIIAIAVLSTAACGFQPLYSGGKKGQGARELASISIEPIADRSGQLLHNALLDLMNPYGSPDRPVYSLRVGVAEGKSELAVKKSEIATRANLRITASYQLIDRKSGLAVFSGSSSIVGSYNILSSDFSTLVAEREARARVIPAVARDIQTRLSAYFRLRKANPEMPATP